MRRRMMAGIAGGALALALALGGTGAVAAAPRAQEVASLAQAGPRQRAAAALVSSLVRATAEVTGLRPREVVAELRAGKSLEQVAVANGKTAQDVIDAARAKLNQRLDRAVANGRITQHQADALLQAFDTNAPKVMSATDLGKRIEQRRGAGPNK